MSNTITFPSVPSNPPFLKGLPDGRAVVDSKLFFERIYPQGRNLILQGDREGLLNLFSGHTIPEFKISLGHQIRAEKEILIGSMLDNSLDEKTRLACADEFKALEHQLSAMTFKRVDEMKWAGLSVYAKEWAHQFGLRNGSFYDQIRATYNPSMIFAPHYPSSQPYSEFLGWNKYFGQKDPIFKPVDEVENPMANDPKGKKVQ